MTLLSELAIQISDGLRRKSATTGSRWAELHRIVNPIAGLHTTTEPLHLNHLYHPWTKDMRDCNESWVCPKGAQLGITEVGLDRALFTIDVKHESVLYLLPKKTPDAADFSKSRFGTAIDLSPYLKNLFSDVNNVGHKKAGSVSLYIRGTRTKSGVKSLPVGTVIADEYDEMVLANLAQAMERMSGRIHKQLLRFSTPTTPKFGISKAFETTTQEHYFFHCPHCSRLIELVFPDDLVITGDSLFDRTISQSHIRCNRCHHPLDHTAKSQWLTTETAQWVPSNTDYSERGFYVNQLYSFTVSPVEIAKTAIKAETNPADEQEFWNSKGGLPFIHKDGGLTDDQVINCKGSFANGLPLPPSGFTTLGVDQGKKIYYQVNQWFLPTDAGPDINSNAFAKCLRTGFVNTFEDLYPLMHDYQIRMAVIDAHPERRKAEEFARKFYGFVWLCLYNRGVNGRSINTNPDQLTVSVDRTSWLDVTLNRIRTKRILIPGNLPADYSKHLCALIRRYDKDPNGNPVARYINNGPDHHAHAMNYAEIALPLAVARQSNSAIGDYL